MWQLDSDRLLVDASPIAPAPPPDGRGRVARTVDLGELVRILRRRRRVVFAAVAVAMSSAVGFLFTTTPRFTATATVLIDPRTENVLDSQAVLSSFGRDDVAVESQVLLMQSPPVLRRAVAAAGLLEDDEFGPPPDAAARIAAAGDGGRSMVVDLAVAQLQRRLRVVRQGATFVVDINIRSLNPDKAARVANAVADGYLLEQVGMRYDATKLAADWLDRQIGDLKERVLASEKAVEDYRAEHNLVAAQGVMVNDQQITDLNNRVIEARVQTAEARARYRQVQDIVASGGDTGATAEALSSDVIGKLRAQYAEIAKNKADILSKYGARHPSVATVQAQLRDTQRLINEEVRRILDGTRHAYDVARSREDALQKSLDGLKGVSTNSGQSLVRLRELQREAEANRALYESFLARFKETRAQESAQRADSRVVARASPPLVASFPKRGLTLALALAAGLGLGCVFAFTMDHMDDRVRTVRQLEDLTGVETLASVPLISVREIARRARRGRADIDRLPASYQGMMPPSLQSPLLRYAVEEPASLFAEAVRGVRYAIQRAARVEAAQVIMVASASTGEGKSTLAANVALSCAAAGARVVLVDGDMRNPMLTGDLYPGARAGLIEVIPGRCSLERALVRDDPTGMWFLPTVPTDEVSALVDLASTNGLRAVLGRLRQVFDVIIVDSPPLLALVDARSMAEHVDRILLTVAWGRTPAAVVARGIDSLGAERPKVLGTVITQVDLEALQLYDYYHSAIYLQDYAYYRRIRQGAAS